MKEKPIEQNTQSVKIKYLLFYCTNTYFFISLCKKNT